MASTPRLTRSARRRGSPVAVRCKRVWLPVRRAVTPTLMACAAAVGAVLLTAATGAGQLPPEVQADAYLLEVEQAIGDGNYDRAWDRLQDIVSLQTNNDLDIPEFHFWYAKAADAMSMSDQALESVTEYLTAGGRQAAHYAEALALLNALQAAVRCQGWDAEAYFETATPEQVTACLETATVDLDARDASGLTPLHAAATHAEDPAVIQALLDAGAPVDATDAVSGATPLSLAIRDNGVPAIIEVLLAGGSNPETPDKTGLTPLHLAALHTDDSVVYEILLTAPSGLTTPEQVLEAAERSIEILIENGASPIHLEQALESVMRDLAAAGLDVANDVTARALTNAVRCAGWNTDGYFETATLEQVTTCLETSAVDLTAPNASGFTPLHSAAASTENPAVVEALLAAGANLEARNGSRGETPLHSAAGSNENPAVVAALIAAGANVQEDADGGMTPLHYAACCNENPAVIDTLLAAGANVREDADGDKTPLHYAADNNENPAVIETLIAAGANVREDADDGMTPLHYAAGYNENPAVVAALIAAGANAQEDADGDLTALHYAAAFNENPAVIEALIAAGANVREDTDGGRRPLHQAAIFNENPAVIETLLAAGADLGDRDQFLHTPLHWAASSNENPAIVEVLLKAGTDLETKAVGFGIKMHTTLQMAASSGSPGVIETLLRAGADPLKEDSDDSTLLHLAARYNSDPNVIGVLLSSGFSLEAQDDEERTPLHLAARYNENPAVLEALLTAGADIEAVDEDGRTPLYRATDENENPAVREALLAAGAVERQRASEQGDGLGRGIAALIGGAAIAAAGAESGASPEAVADAVGQFAEGVLTGQPAGGASGTPFAGQAPTNTGGVSTSGPGCQIPGYPTPTNVQSLGLNWCESNVDFQKRAFALQAAGAWCAIDGGTSSTPEQIRARHQEINAACDTLDALEARLGGRPCRCPAGYRPGGGVR